MKKYLRVIAVLAMLSVFSGMFVVTAAAEEAEESDMFVESTMVTSETISAIREIQVKSVTTPIAAVDMGETHCAVLFEDGTVKAFQCAGWFHGCFDYKECNTAKWSGIQVITCRSECTFGLKKDGSIVWTGRPERRGFDSGDTEFDEGWKKISKDKKYTDIASGSYMPLFALRSDGTVDIAFQGYEEYDGVKDLTDIIDILTYSSLQGRFFAALDSKGTITLLPEYGTPKTFVCKGAKKICVRDSRLCAVMSDGSVKDIGCRIVEPENEAAVLETLKPLGTVSHVWTVESDNNFGRCLARMKTGEVYLVQEDYTGKQTVKQLKGWENLTEVCEFYAALPNAADEEWIRSEQGLEILVGIMEDGTMRTEYTFYEY